MWIIEVRATPKAEWEIVIAVEDADMARAVQELLKEDEVGEVRAREYSDLPPGVQKDLSTRGLAPMDPAQVDRWWSYRIRAMERLAGNAY